MYRCIFGCVLVAAGLLGARSAHSQTTDGYHSLQVFPVVVDTASFTQRFNFRNPTGIMLTIAPSYFPAEGTTQATPLDCPTFDILPLKTATFASLRAMCPGLAGGSQFGFLHLRVTNASVLPFAAFSRVSNPQGNGFTVEAFAATEFTAADAFVNGLRRLAATNDSPAFQTNCFFGLVNNLETDWPMPDTTLTYTVNSSTGGFLGQAQVVLTPGKIVRVLDIFSAVGAPAGDHDNASMRILESGPLEPGVIAFCTVQDNTSFGADFRIAKQELGDGGIASPGVRSLGTQSDLSKRLVLQSQDGLGRPFTIPAGSFSNTHVLRVHQPDYGYCEIIDPNTGVRALPAYGLEIRAMDPESGETIAGGDNSTVVPDPGKGDGLYFGDRADTDQGTDGVAYLEIESNEQNTGSARPYKLQCRSGSGMPPPDIVRYQEAVDRF